MDALDLARWQFGITTVYHFLFVPLTIGLSVIVAGLHTAWHRTGKPEYLRLTKFFGKLFLINFAMGVVTGIVQEFQFGMNWSDYSRFVGDVFGAPLAMEGLLAFFLESTFLGLWIFGWDRLPRRVHLATIWVTALGSNLSAYFILSANAWMKHPVGYTVDARTGRARLTDIWALLASPTALVEYVHVAAGAFVTAGVFVVAVSAYRLLRTRDTALLRPALRAGMAVTVVAGLLSAGSGDLSAELAARQQPMKLAAAEALWNGQRGADLSVFSAGGVDVRVPRLLGLLARHSPDGYVAGIDDVQRQYAAVYGPGDYRPNILVSFWSFRLMIAFGLAAAALSALGLWLTRRGRDPGRRFLTAAVFALPLPVLAATMGWLLSEIGRQPWTVLGELLTADSVSPGVSVAEVATSLTVFTLLYGVLAVVEGWLIVHFVRQGPPPPEAEPAPDEPAQAPAFSY